MLLFQGVFEKFLSKQYVPRLYGFCMQQADVNDESRIISIYFPYFCGFAISSSLLIQRVPLIPLMYGGRPASGDFEENSGREPEKNKSFFFKLCMYIGDDHQPHFNQER